MKIATWNVNSVKARLPNVLNWLKDARPDVVLLQELKCQTDAFPALEIEDLGYNLAVHGQKTYNGVAILSKLPIEDIRRGLPGGGAALAVTPGAPQVRDAPNCVTPGGAPGDDNDPQARYIDATVAGVRVASIYLPNGNPAPGEKFNYKLAWMDRLLAHAKTLLADDETLVMGGDYNVCPTDDDVHDPEAFARDALCRPESRAKYRAMLNLGLWDACRALYPDAKHAYTYWDYQQRSFELDHGLRIDHLLLSPQAADRLTAYAVDRKPRAQPKASDHTPVIIDLKD